MPRTKLKDQKTLNYQSLAWRILKIRDIALSPGSHFENVPTWGFTHYRVNSESYSVIQASNLEDYHGYFLTWE